MYRGFVAAAPVIERLGGLVAAEQTARENEAAARAGAAAAVSEEREAKRRLGDVRLEYHRVLAEIGASRYTKVRDVARRRS
jgi:hypothetical protein